MFSIGGYTYYLSADNKDVDVEPISHENGQAPNVYDNYF